MNNHSPSASRLAWLPVLGVVYGDIGTSPLYALKGCPQHDIIGLISVFIWTLFLIVTLKYVCHVLKLDNKGEGGIIALVTLGKRLAWGVIGLALFLGDSVLTPAISVLGALEGLNIATPNLPFGDAIPALASLLLLGLFGIQRIGTYHIGRLFGPIMAVWFVALAVMGVPAIISHPAILKAFDPRHAVNFLLNGSTSFCVVMGHALLAVTGGEALYADLGHFGKRPIQQTWLRMVWPALMLNYLGQGAMLLASPVNNPFYALAPSWGLMPLIILATVASLIASQAVISGVFSLAWQGMMLGYFPRMRVVHTSIYHVGQIYVPAMNTLMCWGTLFAVGFFQSSESLGMAYGLSVASLMWMTTLLSLLMRPSPAWAFVLCAVGLLETGLVISSISKFWHGAWYALAMALAACYVISVWRLRFQRVHKSLGKRSVQDIVQSASQNPRLPGIGVFVQKVEQATCDAPLPLVLHEKYHVWLPEKVICVNIVVSNDVSKVRMEDRYKAEELGQDVYVIQATYGFKEIPDLSRVMAWALDQHFMPANDAATPYFYWGRVMPVVTQRVRFWRNPGEKLFVLLARLQTSPYELIRTPYARSLELVTHVKV